MGELLCPNLSKENYYTFYVQPRWLAWRPMQMIQYVDQHEIQYVFQHEILELIA